MLNGGYTREGGVQHWDMTLTGYDEDLYGGDYTTEMSGTFAEVDGALSGTVSVSTTDASGVTSVLHCAFDGMDVSEMIAAHGNDAVFERLWQRFCPQVWDEQITQRFRFMHLHPGDDTPMHFLLPGQSFSASNRVRPNRTKRAHMDTTRGDLIEVRYGRGGQVWGTISCPWATDLYDLRVVYGQGLGLQPYTIFCYYEGTPPPMFEEDDPGPD